MGFTPGMKREGRAWLCEMMGVAPCVVMALCEIKGVALDEIKDVALCEIKGMAPCLWAWPCVRSWGGSVCVGVALCEIMGGLCVCGRGPV